MHGIVRLWATVLTDRLRGWSDRFGLRPRTLLLLVAAIAVWTAALLSEARAQTTAPSVEQPLQTYVIGFSQATTSEPWRLKFNSDLRMEAAKHPELTVLIRDGQDSIEKQIADVAEFIERNVDAILISPKVSDALTPIVAKAHNLAIPVIVLDRDLNEPVYTQFIGGDNVAIGRAAGEYAVSMLGGAGAAQGSIVEIWGGKSSSPAQDRHRGFRAIVDQEPGITILGSDMDGDWKQHLGYSIMDEQLSAHSQIDLVYAHNDPMAHGAYLAAKDMGREKDIRFLGIDGIPEEGQVWVQQGILDATFLYQTPGAEAIRQVLTILGGAEFEPRIILPTAVIDRHSLSPN